MTCRSCSAEVASTTVFCPHCGERVQLESEWQPTGLLVQDRRTTVLNPDSATGALSVAQAGEVLSWLTAEREKGKE